MFTVPVSEPIISRYEWCVIRLKPNFHNSLDWGII